MSHFTEVSYWQAAKPYESEQIALVSLPNTAPTFDDSVQLLRTQLRALNAWPEAGDTFLDLLEQVRGYGVTLVPTDYDWLNQVAESAYKGEDIGLRYPSIFQKLLTFPELRQKFLHILKLRSADA
ncbi:MAG: hypothetical protein H6657_11925 [Ardenticatenaceae bacterium]|nr:hypothetical protein [Ardenticatenaceae bacterium]